MVGIAEDALLIPLAGGSHTMVFAPGLDGSGRVTQRMRMETGVPKRSRTSNPWLRRMNGRAQTTTSQALTAALRIETEGYKWLTSH